MKKKINTFLVKRFLQCFIRMFFFISIFYEINTLESEEGSNIITFDVSSPQEYPFQPISIKSYIGETETTDYYMISLFSPIISYDSEIPEIPSFLFDGDGELIDLNSEYSLQRVKGTKYSGNVALISQNKQKYILNGAKILQKSSPQRKGYLLAHSCIGLSYSLDSSNSFNFLESETTWESLKALKINKIFSINKLNQFTVEYTKKYIYNFLSELYLGEVHEDFIKSSKGKKIFSCKINNFSLPFWGCSFSQLKINDKTFNLNNNNTSYTSYFVTEDYKIVLPLALKENIINSFNTAFECKSNEDTFVCDKFHTTNNTFLPIEFIDEKKKNSIISEIHDTKFYEGSTVNDKDTFSPNIIFADIEYLVLPIYMFKNFHILFNGEENVIKFFGDENLIKTSIEEEEKEKASSSSYTVVIIIICILLVIVVLAVVYFFVIKKRGSNGGRFHILDEDEDFHNMNENRVY